MGTLLDVINHEEVSKPRVNAYLEECMKDVCKVVNHILNDIVTNTYAFIQLKSNFSKWRNKLFDLDIINREMHRKLLSSENENGFPCILPKKRKHELARLADQICFYTRIRDKCFYSEVIHMHIH